MGSIELVADADTDTDTDTDADTDASVPGAAAAALGDLTRAVDVLQQHSLDGLRDEDLLGVFQQLERQRRRLAAVDHRLITELECRSTAVKFLARGTAGLLTDLLHVDAAVLGPRTAITGEALDPVYPATAAAQAAGAISERHARVITGTVGHLPPAWTPTPPLGPNARW